MPKSRKRRPKRIHRQTAPPRQNLSAGQGLAGLRPFLEHIAAVDEAERRGDAAAAMELIEERLLGPDGKLFWRRWRILRLSQLALFGPWLPGWATSRWLLEQALQDLDLSRRAAMDKALRVAVEIQGGAQNVRHPPGEDHRIKVMDTDWVFRQCLLYDYGHLTAFLRRAPADLVAGADRIQEWARSPMGGYRLQERRPSVTTWVDHATGELIETANIGSAALVMPGESVIGRLVPIEGGRMFETVPLRVPERVAHDVAADPEAWSQALRDARTAGEPAETGGCPFGFLTDVPWEVSAITAYDDFDLLDDYPRRVTKLLSTVRKAFVVPNDNPEEVDVWACLAAEVLHPNVFTTFAQKLDPGDADLFDRLGATLAEPAATFCRQLASGARGAA